MSLTPKTHHPPHKEFPNEEKASSLLPRGVIDQEASTSTVSGKVAGAALTSSKKNHPKQQTPQTKLLLRHM
jgi:hypothetical protein